MKTIDWNATEERASMMSDTALHYALIDILKTLPHADAMDRETGGNDGGYYRDEASVYHAELKRRRHSGRRAPR
jgi:aminoglycoside phosphotransferase (APT) family kinase protein